VGDDASLPNALDKNTQNVKFGRRRVGQGGPHYKNGVCVSRVCEPTFDASDVGAAEHAYEVGAPYAPQQH